MSGQPYLNSYDAPKFRSQYMANLELQAKNDDINFQANKIFKKTGQTPSQPTDTRSTTEKIADIERLKMDLRASLSQVADGQQAQEIVNQLGQDPADILFCAQHINEIINMIKGKWKYGVLAPAFMDLYNHYKESFELTSGLTTGNQAVAGNQLLLTIQDIQRNMITPAILTVAMTEVENARGLMETRLGTALMQELSDLKGLIPPNLGDMISSLPPEMALLIMKDIAGILESLPTGNQLQELLIPLKTAIAHKDRAATNAAAMNIKAATTIPPVAKQQLASVATIAAGGGGGGGKTTPLKASNLMLIWEKNKGNLTALSKNQLSQIIGEALLGNPDSIGHPPAGKSKNKADLMVYLTTNEKVVNAFYGTAGASASTPITTGMTMGKSAPTVGQVAASQGKMKGKGISVDYTKGVQETNKSKYVPFGKFIINPKRLENDIIAIRRPKGSVPIPTQRTSQKLGGVIRKIVGGGTPSFEDLNALDEDEKHYLHKLMKSTNLIDRISVPAPSKEQDDKDINRFEVLRGEIMSGNDSHQLIKEFKLLILKLVNKDLLPKTQSREILYDLMALGF